MLKKKHSFLLFELLIAIFLVGMCALPLAEIPVQSLKEEIASCYRLQLQRLSDLAFAEIKALLYRNEIPWESLTQQTAAEKVRIIDDTPVDISLKELGKRRFERRCFVYSRGKKNDEGKEFRLLKIFISFQTKPHGFALFPRKSKDKDTTVFRYEVMVMKEKATAESKEKE